MLQQPVYESFRGGFFGQELNQLNMALGLLDGTPC